MEQIVKLEDFSEEWLKSVREGKPSTSELGHRFARKMLTHWLDIEDASDDLVYCDGSGDGGIDIAYLHRGDSGDGDDLVAGDTWYLVQSKYGSAFQGQNTLLGESRKIIDSLDGKTARLSSLAEGLLERLKTFRRQASDRDRIVLIFATVVPLTEDEKRTLADVRAMGRERLGGNFDVDSISIATVYQRQLEEAAASSGRRITVPIKAEMVDSGTGLLIGSTSLLCLYDFLKAYRTATEDLDQLYEKNVRRFLGGRGKVNKAIVVTLREHPEKFGLYNNGITIVVADFAQNEDGTFGLIEPYVVNGCQTTRTIWEVCHQRMEAGGTGSDPELEEWRQRASKGVVVTKIVKVGNDGEPLLEAITRYTNSQNAIREKDFLAITSDFKTWKSQMSKNYGVFLEIQRGGWESCSAWQKQNPSDNQFTEHANAFDILKVYGAGWLGEAGTAYGRNAAFLPTGSIFKRIVSDEDSNESFGVEDLYAAYRLMQAAEKYKFGRTAERPSRRLTKFLYYLVIVKLLKDVLTRANNTQPNPKDITAAILVLFAPENVEALNALLDTAMEVIDEYLTQGTEDSAFNEPSYQNTFNGNLNSYIKWDQLGKTEDASPRFQSLVGAYCRTLGRSTGGKPSPRDLIASAIKN